MSTDDRHGWVVVPGGGGGPGDRAQVGGEEVLGPGLLLDHSSEGRAPPGPPGGEGEVRAVAGGSPVS